MLLHHCIKVKPVFHGRFEAKNSRAGKQECADWHGVFPERGKHHRRARLEGLHQEPGQPGFHRASQRLAQEREPAAKHDHGWMKEMDRVRKAERQILSRLVEDSHRSLIPRR